MGEAQRQRARIPPLSCHCRRACDAAVVPHAELTASSCCRCARRASWPLAIEWPARTGTACKEAATAVALTHAQRDTSYVAGERSSSVIRTAPTAASLTASQRRECLCGERLTMLGCCAPGTAASPDDGPHCAHTDTHTHTHTHTHRHSTPRKRISQPAHVQVRPTVRTAAGPLPLLHPWFAPACLPT